MLAILPGAWATEGGVSIVPTAGGGGGAGVTSINGQPGPGISIVGADGVDVVTAANTITITSSGGLPIVRTEQDILDLPGTTLNGSAIEVTESFIVEGAITLTGGRDITVKADNVAIEGTSFDSKIIVQNNGGSTIIVDADDVTIRNLLVQQNASNGTVIRIRGVSTRVEDCLLVGNQNTGFSINFDTGMENARIVNSELRGQVVQNNGDKNFSLFNCDLLVGTALANFLGQTAVPTGVTEFIACRFTGPDALGSVETTQPRNFQIEDCTILSGAALFRYAVSAGTVQLEIVGNELRSAGSPLISLGDNAAMVIADSVISSNVLDGPVILLESGASTTDKEINDTLISNNRTTSGQVISHQGDSLDLLVQRCTLQANRCQLAIFSVNAAQSTDAIVLTDCTVVGNIASQEGVNLDSGFFRAADCTFSNNRVSSGALIRAGETNAIQRCTVVGNRCGNDLFQIDGDNLQPSNVAADNIVERHVFFVDDPGVFTGVVEGNVAITGPFVSSSGQPWSQDNWPDLTARGNRGERDFGDDAVFGQGYLSKDKSGEETTPDDTPIVYDTLTIPADTLDPAGTYRGAIFAQGIATLGNTQIQIRGLLNGTPNDATLHTLGVQDGRVPFLDVFQFSGALNTGAAVTVAVDYASPGGGGEAGIARSLIEIWRVA